MNDILPSLGFYVRFVCEYNQQSLFSLTIPSYGIVMYVCMYVCMYACMYVCIRNAYDLAINGYKKSMSQHAGTDSSYVKDSELTSVHNNAVRPTTYQYAMLIMI